MWELQYHVMATGEVVSGSVRVGGSPSFRAAVVCRTCLLLYYEGTKGVWVSV